MYELRFHRKVDKELSNIPREVRKKIRDVYFPLLSKEPQKVGKPLSGSLSGLWRLDFRMLKTKYRIAYEIVVEENVVYILMVGKREGFYDRLRRRYLLSFGVKSS